MTSPEYVIEFMRDADLRYFIVANGYDKDVMRHFAPTELDESVKLLQRFFEKSTGAYRVKLFNSNELKRDGYPRAYPQIFEVHLTGKKLFEEEKEEKPSGGMGGFEGLGYPPYQSGEKISIEQYVAALNENADLKRQVATLELRIEFLKDQVERDKQMMQNEFEREKQRMKEDGSMQKMAMEYLTNGGVDWKSVFNK